MVDDAKGQSVEVRGRLPGALEVQTILQHGDRPPEDLPSASSHGSTITSPPNLLSRSHSTSSRHSLTRSRSINDPSRRNKRLSLTLPIQTAFLNTQTRGSASPTRSIASSTTIPEDFTPSVDGSDTTFLTALAAQERRVLELREELLRAEADLKKLKREWAAHEVQKKRHDSRIVHKMRPLSATSPTGGAQEEEVGSSASRAQELERRRSMLSSNKSSSRTVFSGSRHARTLSLLPTAGHAVQTSTIQPPKDPSSMPEQQPTRPPLSQRLSSNADLTQEVVDVADESIDLGLPREVLMRTGKQMASDFKDGLWTFIEDLRQATVGEEAIQGVRTRSTPGERTLTVPDSRFDRGMQSKQAVARSHHSKPQTTSGAASAREGSSSSSRRSNAREGSLIDVGSSFWQENGLDDPAPVDMPVIKKTTPKKSPKKSSVPHRSIQESPSAAESWDMWDSPVPQRSKATSRAEVQTMASANGVSSNSRR